MTTISIKLEDRLLEWLRARSYEAGMTPEEVVADTLRRQELSERFLTLTKEIGEKAARRGLTQEKLDELLRGGEA
jgi:hypothetical protein